MDKSDFAKRLANKLIEQLKAGTAPWQQPWEAGQMASPYNPTTGNRYRGVNILALMANAYTDPRWMTYKQAQGQGWQVRGHRFSIGFGRRPGRVLEKTGNRSSMTQGNRLKTWCVCRVRKCWWRRCSTRSKSTGFRTWSRCGMWVGPVGKGGEAVRRVTGEDPTFARGRSVLSSFDRYDSFAGARTI